MRRIFLISLLYLLSNTVILGQNARIEVRGKVIDKNTGHPLVSSNVKIQDNSLGAITNELGEFYLISNKLPVMLEVSHVGYESEQYSVEFEPLQPITIELELSALRIL